MFKVIRDFQMLKTIRKFKKKEVYKEEDIYIQEPQQPQIEIIHTWECIDKDFKVPGALIKVTEGKGLLKGVYGEVDEKKVSFCACMFGDKPLLQLQGDEYFCPTCEKIVKSGYGLDESFHFEQAEIIEKYKDSKIEFLEAAINNMVPILGLLRSGFYIIVDTKLHPTDGNGNFFWDSQSMNPIKGSSMYCDGYWLKSQPHFTIATQPKGKCKRERVEYFIEHTEDRAIAYYMDGYMTALIDGHHKTLAAALRKEDVNAFVIMPRTRIKFGETSETRGFCFGEVFVSEEKLMIGKIDRKNLDQYTIGKRLSKEDSLKVWESFYKYEEKDSLLFETDGLVKYYPTVEEQADIERVGYISEEMLEQILRKEKICLPEEAVQLMRALGALKHEKAREIGLFFSNQDYEITFMRDIIKVMARVLKGEEREDYLIDKMVELEYYHPDIKDMILDLL